MIAEGRTPVNQGGLKMSEFATFLLKQRSASVFYEKVPHHLIHDVKLVPACFMNDYPGASLKRTVNILPNLQLQSEGFLFCRTPGCIRQFFRTHFLIKSIFYKLIQTYQSLS